MKTSELLFKTLVDKLMNVLTGMEQFINSPELKNSAGTFNQTFVNFDGLVTQAKGQLGALDPKVDKLLDDLAILAEHADTAVTGTDQELRLTIRDMHQTMADISTATGHLVTTLNGLDAVAGENRELPCQLGRTLEEVRQAARSAGNLADYLQRHPSALVPGPEEERQ